MRPARDSVLAFGRSPLNRYRVRPRESTSILPSDVCLTLTEERPAVRGRPFSALLALTATISNATPARTATRPEDAKRLRFMGVGSCRSGECDARRTSRCDRFSGWHSTRRQPQGNLSMIYEMV